MFSTIDEFSPGSPPSLEVFLRKMWRLSVHGSRRMSLLCLAELNSLGILQGFSVCSVSGVLSGSLRYGSFLCSFLLLSNL